MKRIGLIALFLACITIGVSAQTTSNIELKDISIKKENANVQISFKLLTGKKTVKSNYKLVITPILYNQNDTARLKQITVYTRKSGIIQKREHLSAGKHAIDIVDEYRAANNAVVDYSFAMPYQEWMNHSNLYLDTSMRGCCTEENSEPMALVHDVVLVTPVVPLIEIPAKAPEISKWEFHKKDMVIDFPVSKTNIDLDLFQNREVLTEVIAVLKNLKETEVEIDKIEITGYASPEGKTNFNMKLGNGRSKALQQYLMAQVPQLKETDFVLINGGENWNGLREMIASSNMQYKEEALYIIDNVPAEIDVVKNSSRKKQLMDLKGGKPYNYMLKNFYPKLRNACYIGIYYLEKQVE